MTFAVPGGTAFVGPLGAGSVFEVAVVDAGGTRVVCKRVRRSLRHEPIALAALEREAHALRLAAPVGVLPAPLGADRDDHGPYLLQEWVQAGSLAGLREQAQDRVAPGKLRRLMARAFERLAALHALRGPTGPLGLVHGDLRPDHVLVTAADDIRFVDMGQARWRDMSPGVTADRGTVPYAAPELAAGGEPASQSTDVYGLAASFAYVAVGEALCRAQAPAARLVEIVDEGLRLSPLRRSQALDEPTRAVLLAALRWRSDERLRDAAEVADRLAVR